MAARRGRRRRCHLYQDGFERPTSRPPRTWRDVGCSVSVCARFGASLCICMPTTNPSVHVDGSNFSPFSPSHRTCRKKKRIPPADASSVCECDTVMRGSFHSAARSCPNSQFRRAAPADGQGQPPSDATIVAGRVLGFSYRNTSSPSLGRCDSSLVFYKTASIYTELRTLFSQAANRFQD